MVTAIWKNPKIKIYLLISYDFYKYISWNLNLVAFIMSSYEGIRYSWNIWNSLERISIGWDNDAVWACITSNKSEWSYLMPNLLSFRAKYSFFTFRYESKRVCLTIRSPPKDLKNSLVLLIFLERDYILPYFKMDSR